MFTGVKKVLESKLQNKMYNMTHLFLGKIYGEVKTARKNMHQNINTRPF